jgi:hypothetical protein
MAKRLKKSEFRIVIARLNKMKKYYLIIISMLIFKGSVHVFSTTANYDQKITLSEEYPPEGAIVSSVIHLFYIKFEKI